MATNLINFKQIQDGALVSDAVKEWLKSGYPAKDVVTKIVKTPAYTPTAEELAAGKTATPAVYFNVEELLAELKKVTDTVLGDGDQSISQMIDAAKKEVQDDLDVFKAKKIRDYFKLTGFIDHDGTVTLNDPIDRNDATYLKEAAQGIHRNETLGIYDLDVAKAYNVYYEDNTPVRDKDGNNVTLTFKKAGVIEGIGKGVTDAVLQQALAKDPGFKYGSIVSDTPHLRDTKVSLHSVENVDETLNAAREIQLAHKNIAPGTLRVLHQHQYYVPGEHGPSLVNEWHDANVDHVSVVDKNKELNLPASSYYFNGAAGRILFKQDMSEAFKISYQYRMTDITFTQDTEDKRKIKLFPVGSWALKDLNENFLLDNNELNLVAYSQAIDKIVEDLRGDEQLIDYITSLLSTQEVQNAIVARTEELNRQANNNKLELYNRDIDLENTMRDLGYEIDQLAKIKNNANKIDELTVTVAKADGGQTEFNLKKVPNKKPVVLWINGVRYLEGKHFTVDRARTVLVGTDKKITAAPQLVWTFNKKAGGFDICLEDNFDMQAQYDLVTSVASVPKLPYYTMNTMNNATAAEEAKKKAYEEARALAQKAGTTLPDNYIDLNDRPYNNDLSGNGTPDETVLKV